MENIIIKWGSNEYVVDSDRTVDRYNALIADFINSDLFSINPCHAADEELDELLEKRAHNESGFSWIEQSNRFYSRCHLSEVIHVNDTYPWDQLYFQPWQNFPVITMNRFNMLGNVLLDNERRTLPYMKKYEVLGAHGDTTNLNYFVQNVGSPFIYCYRFDMVDDFRQRWCLRFAENSYKRESLLLTQFFSLSFLINHPLECFPVPYLCGSDGGIHDMEAMSSLLSPIIEDKRDCLISHRARLREMMILHNLQAEEF